MQPAAFLVFPFGIDGARGATGFCGPTAPGRADFGTSWRIRRPVRRGSRWGGLFYFG
jgi:hypothetical protein